MMVIISVIGVGIFYRNDSNIEICEEDLYQFVKYKNANYTIFCVYLSKGCDFNQVVQIHSVNVINYKLILNVCHK